MMNDFRSQIGLRINPVVGGGAIAIISTATKQSKFGLPVDTDDNRARIADLYARYDWLRGVHVHVGSQGTPVDLFVKGARVRSKMLMVNLDQHFVNKITLTSNKKA